MFMSSTQYSSWTFKNDQDLQNLRVEANKNFIEKHAAGRSEAECQSHFLSADEELLLVREYVFQLRKFCQNFKDPRDSRIHMPMIVTTTATHYLLRFYLYNSVMDYHPRDIMHTCIYLSCKIEEFFVTISDYVHNVEGDERQKEMTAMAILNSELQTTQELQFHLIVHQPYRPVEGLIIDLKTRYPTLQDADGLRVAVDQFLDRAHHTDAVLFYSPSQLALAAVTTAASKVDQNLDAYVTDILFADAPGALPALIDAVRKIKRFVKNADNRASEATLADIETRLAVCRNPMNDPSTEEYRINQARLEQNDDDFGPMISSNSVDSDGLCQIQQDDMDTSLTTGSTGSALAGDRLGRESVGLDKLDKEARRSAARTKRGEQQGGVFQLRRGGIVDDDCGGEFESGVVGGVVGVGLGMRSADEDEEEVIDLDDEDDECVLED